MVALNALMFIINRISCIDSNSSGAVHGGGDRRQVPSTSLSVLDPVGSYLQINAMFASFAVTSDKKRQNCLIS